MLTSHTPKIPSNYYALFPSLNFSNAYRTRRRGNFLEVKIMRKLAAIAVLMLVPSLAQAQVSSGNACSATPQDLNAWAQTVASQAELDEIIAELQACPGLNVFRINQLIRAVAVGAAENPNVVIAGSESIQLELPAAVQNQINNNSPSSSEPRRTASASG